MDVKVDSPASAAQRGGVDYARPPIEEALCSVTFSPPLAWNVATPGQLFEGIKDNYPQSPESQEQMQAQLTMASPQAVNGITLNSAGQRFIYKDPSGTKLLIAAQNVVSVNSLRPYEGWPALRARLRDALRSVNQVTPLTNASVISLHYINKIIIPQPAIDTDEFFNITVRTAEEGRAAIAGFVQRTESRLTDGVTRVIETFATLPSADDTNAFLLDLDFQRHDLTIDDVDDVLTIADQLKVQENTEFESCLKESARTLFR